MTAHYPDHVTRGVQRLIERYRTPKTSALLASWLTEVQAAEDALWQLMTERAIDTAYGVTLDVLGAIVGQPREGRSDDEYRLWISAASLVSRSQGTPEELIAITRKLIPAGSSARLEEYYPAAFLMRVGGGLDVSDGYEIAQLLRRAKPAGVGMHLTWTAPGADVFTFAPGDVPVAPVSPMGFDHGHWAYVADGTQPVPLPAAVTYGGVLVTYAGAPVTYLAGGGA
jgi:hypothetical protein